MRSQADALAAWEARKAREAGAPAQPEKGSDDPFLAADAALEPVQPTFASEREFMAWVLDLAREHGWMAYHTFDSRRSEAGFPDLCLVRGRCTLYAECKTDTGTLTVEQDRWLTALARAGNEVWTWRPRDVDVIQWRLSVAWEV